MNEWQPIETAPRNGVNVLVWDSESELILVAAYIREGNFWAVEMSDQDAYPTHWMPLPAAPANPEDPAHD